MEEYMVVWGTRIVALGFILYFSFDRLVLRMLRRMDVIGYKPFASRAEYLVAALEMNLEDFIGRAKATPDHVKRKAPQEKPMSILALVNQVGELLKNQPEIQKTKMLDVTTSVGGPGFAGGDVQASLTPLPSPAKTPGFPPMNALGGIGLLSSVLGGNNLFGVSAAQRRDEKLVKKFPLDRWFRTLGGELVKATAVLDGMITCNTIWGTLNYLPDHLGPAFPREGEWWRWTKHELLDGFNASHLEPFCFGSDIASRMAREVEAGNLEPVNCGRGEQKSGVA